MFWEILVFKFWQFLPVIVLWVHSNNLWIQIVKSRISLAAYLDFAVIWLVKFEGGKISICIKSIIFRYDVPWYFGHAPNTSILVLYAWSLQWSPLKLLIWILWWKKVFASKFFTGVIIYIHVNTVIFEHAVVVIVLIAYFCHFYVFKCFCYLETFLYYENALVHGVGYLRWSPWEVNLY